MIRDTDNLNSKYVTVSELASALGYYSDKLVPVSSLVIDSRKVTKNSVFVAFKGKSQNGHDFLRSAMLAGAIAAVVEEIDQNVPILQWKVSSSLDAIKILAKKFRDKVHCPVIAITGSNGKTTVKNMVANILPQPSFATIGNFNNEIGVPLSISNLKPEHLYAVFELGANKKGDIDYTVDLVRPDIALINNIGNAHIEGFGSEEGVAQAKSEIYKGLNSSGIAIINYDDKWHNYWHPIISEKKTIKYSLSAGTSADIFARDLQLVNNGCYKFELCSKNDHCSLQLKVPGLHSVYNALAAASCAYALKLPFEIIIQGLESFSGVAGRLMQMAGKNLSLIIDDTYNANLNSFKAAIAVLAAMPGQRILVMGDMGELGDFALQHHREVGLIAKKAGVDMLLTVGSLSLAASESFGERAAHYETKEDLVAALLPMLTSESKVLVKGSRSSNMEHIVSLLAI